MNILCHSPHPALFWGSSEPPYLKPVELIRTHIKIINKSIEWAVFQQLCMCKTILMDSPYFPSIKYIYICIDMVDR